MVDTNSDPRGIDYVIPSNDDASKSISKILEHVCKSIAVGISERNDAKEKEEQSESVDNDNESKTKSDKQEAKS